MLVVGTTHGIGLNIVKQYAHAEEEDYVRSLLKARLLIAHIPIGFFFHCVVDELAQLKGDFDGFIEKTANVKLHTEYFDIGRDPKAIVENVANWDKLGPITHLHVASGLSAEPDKKACGLVSVPFTVPFFADPAIA